MRVLITGGSKSGKSHAAERISLALAGDRECFYLATMVPGDDEDRRRILEHQKRRTGKPFLTIECRGALPEKADPAGTYLLDSTTALLAAAMFGTDSFRYDPEAPERLSEEMRSFAEQCGNWVAVSDRIDRDTGRYDPMTEAYLAGLSRMDLEMAKWSDAVAEYTFGCMHPVYGRLPENERKEFREGQMELIIGGAHQGKTSYAMDHFGIPASEVYYCREDGKIDPDRRCIANLEKYAAACAEKGTEPIPPSMFRKDAVLIFTDIFCGVVPTDATVRKNREAAGTYGRILAEHAAHVTRIFLGIPEVLR